MKKVFVIVLFGATIILSSQNSFAQTTEAQGACFFNEKVQKLKNVLEDKNLNLDDLTRYNQEFNLRKEILESVLDCLIYEAESYKSILNDLNIKKPEDLNFKQILIKKLNEQLDYYYFRKKLISQLTLEGIKYTAYSIKEERSGRFLPINSTINNFILWNKNDELFELAKNRASEIQKTMQVLKIEKGEDFKKLFDEAINNLDSAIQKHNQAYEAIIAWKNEWAYNLIQESLQELLSTYNSFFEISQKFVSLMTIK